MATSSIANTSAPVSQNLRAEFNALVRGTAVFDLSFRTKIEVSGRDRVRWLNGMITNNIRDLAAGRGVYAFIISTQGRILGDLYAYHLGDTLLLDTDKFQGEKISQTLRKYIIMDKVELNIIDERLAGLGIAGHGTRKILSSVGIEIAELGPLQLVRTTWNDVELTVVRTDAENAEIYELWIEPARTDSLRTALVQAGASSVSDEALELLRIVEARPKYGHDISERDLPQETGQLRALNFNKGCYIGQEIVERIRSRGAVHRQFSSFLVDGPLPAPGTKITGGDKEVGEVTSAAVLPGSQADISIALGYIRREAAESGVPLHAGASRLTITTQPLASISEP